MGKADCFGIAINLEAGLVIAERSEGVFTLEAWGSCGGVAFVPAGKEGFVVGIQAA